MNIEWRVEPKLKLYQKVKYREPFTNSINEQSIGTIVNAYYDQNKERVVYYVRWTDSELMNEYLSEELIPIE